MKTLKLACMVNILFITESNPFGHYNGGQQRTNLIFNALQQVGRVHLFCITDETPPTELENKNYIVHFFGPNNVKHGKLNWIRKLAAPFNPYHIHPANPDFRERIMTLMESVKFDIIFIRYLPPVFICGFYSKKGLIIDVDDIPQDYYLSLFKSRQLTVPTRLLNLAYSIHMLLYGRNIIRNARLLFYSNPEQARSEKSVYLRNIPFNSTGEGKLMNRGTGKRILFVGTFGYLPNVNGIKHFLASIWPLIRANEPDASLEIIGQIYNESIYEEWSSIPGVIVSGFVENLDECYQNARVVVVPIYEGAGTHIKILEAMSYQKAIVLTRFASRGFKDILHHGSNVLIAHSDMEFADGVLRFLNDGEFAKEIGKIAAETISKEFSRESFNQKITESLAKLSK